MGIRLPVESLVDVGKGKPMILLHGYSHNINCWESVIDEFSSTHRVIIPRTPLHSHFESSERLMDIVEYLYVFIKTYGLDEVILLGSSFGGNIALFFAWKYPRLVDKLIIAGNSGFLEINHNDCCSKHLTIDSYEACFPENQLAPDVRGDVMLVTTRGLTYSGKCLDQSSVLPEVLSTISIPVLLIWGLEDTITPPLIALATHHYLPLSDLIFLDGCGHVPMKEQPILFNKHVRNFLNDSVQIN